MRTRMLAFFFGIVLFSQLPSLPSIYWSGLLLPWLMAAVFKISAQPDWLSFLPTSSLGKSFKQICIHSLWLITGGCWILFHAHMHFSNSLPDEWQQQTIKVIGTIESIPVTREYGQSFIFHTEYAYYKGEVRKLSKIKLNWHHTSKELVAGQRWKLFVRLKQPHSMLNPGGFDYEKWALQQSIIATGYVYTKESNELLSVNPYTLHAMRTVAYEKLSSVIEHSAYKGIILALTLGERSQISENQWEIFRKTGTSHLVAISGLHIGLIAGFMFFLIKVIWRYNSYLAKHLSAPYAAALVSVTVAISYAALAGFSVPTLRACIMYSALMFTFLLKRNVASWDVLISSLILVLIIDPFSVLSSGFWLSYAAVCIITYVLTGKIYTDKIRAYFRIQYAIFIFLLPFLIFSFSQISLSAPAVNLIAIPVMSFLLLPATLIGLLLSFINADFAVKWFQLLNYLYDIFWNTLNWFADTPFSVYDVFQSGYLSVLLAIIGALVFLFPARLPLKWLGIIFLLPVFLLYKPKIDEGDLIVTFLDVAQGTSVVIETSNHLLVYDTGAKYSPRFDMGKNVITPFLKSSNKIMIDKLIVSHGDNDHIGGADSILSRFRVQKIDSSVPEKINATVERCREGDSWYWDKINFSYLSPTDYQYNTDKVNGHQQNNSSCVLLVDAGKFRILLAGDIETITENRLVDKYGTAMKANLLLVPHHGSNTSSSEPFLKLVQPDYAVITAGYLNRYRLPNKKVIARYAKYTQAVLYNTAITGAVQFHIKQPQQLHKDMVDIKLYRHQSQAFWRHHNLLN